MKNRNLCIQWIYKYTVYHPKNYRTFDKIKTLDYLVIILELNVDFFLPFPPLFVYLQSNLRHFLVPYSVQMLAIKDLMCASGLEARYFIYRTNTFYSSSQLTCNFMFTFRLVALNFNQSILSIFLIVKL